MTLEGFLSQKTTFPFEIIVYDDASTDSTQSIIKEYQGSHPEIVRPIYASENQYSKGHQTIVETFKLARGKYIAICEGDDYWIDPLKLQKQIDGMKQNPECGLCFHSSYVVTDAKGELERGIRFRRSERMKLFTANEVIAGNGGFMHTGSILFTYDILPKIINYPAFVKGVPGDFYIQIMASLRGGALYIDEPMSVYRVNSSSSVSKDLMSSKTNIKNYLLKNIEFIEGMTKITDFQYEREFKSLRNKNLVHFINNAEWRERNAVYENYKKRVSTGFRLKMYILKSHPIAYMIRIIKGLSGN